MRMWVVERGLLLTGIVSLGLWFGGYLGGVEHPFFAVTASKGQFELEGLPPGTYVVEAWHEQYGLRQATVTLGDDETRTIAFSFGAE